MTDDRQGIVHIIGPEQGFTLPGLTIVCGDSHTATHGAFGSLAFGIGTSEVEHVLATQTLLQRPAKNMRVTVDGALPDGVTAKRCDPGNHRQDRRRRRCRPGHRILRRRHWRPVGGGADDDLQHVDRGRRPRRSDCPRRRHLRLPQGSGDGADRAGLGAGGRLLADAAIGYRRPLRHRSSAERRRYRAARDLGHQPARRCGDNRPGARPGGRARSGSAGGDGGRRSTIWV